MYCAHLSRLGVSYSHFAEAEPTSLTDRSHAAIDACCPELLHTATVDGEDAECRCALPDMSEGETGKLTAPAAGKATATQN